MTIHVIRVSTYNVRGIEGVKYSIYWNYSYIRFFYTIKVRTYILFCTTQGTVCETKSEYIRDVT